MTCFFLLEDLEAGENAPWLASEAMRMASEAAGRFWETATWAVRRPWTIEIVGQTWSDSKIFPANSNSPLPAMAVSQVTQ